jgi:uncharacterized membrane protein
MIMDWWLVVLGACFLTAAVTLTLGLILPRNILTDYFLNMVYLFIVFVFMIIGIVSLSYGLRRG